jgi:hypothetical protein
MMFGPAHSIHRSKHVREARCEHSFELTNELANELG